LLNLKTTLLDIEYTDTIDIKCVEDSYDCFVFIDKKIQKEKIKGLFENKPTVYRYNSNLDKVDFTDLELEKLDRYEVVFEYSCKKNGKCSELIVQTEEKTFIFNDIFKQPSTVKYLSDVEEYFNDKITEVQDAF